jgi:CHAT domain-containing protein
VRAGLTVARVVHLATHAVLSARSPWLSTIALANGAALDLATLSGLELQADLVTLSACDTARGTLGKSDETLGFARGLIAAGARRTLVSLWPVSDVATCELMTVFYRELAAGRPVVQALRTAQLHVRDLPGDAIAALVDGLVAEDGALASAGRRHATLADVPEPAPPAEGFAHPSFWAPFVLIGL